MSNPELSVATAPPATAPTRRQQVINFLASRPGVELSAAEIVKGTGLPYSQTTALLSQMHDEPLVSRVRRGTYVFGLDAKVWVETYVAQGKKSVPAKKRQAKPAAPRSQAAAPAPAPAPSLLGGYSVAGTVLRSPSGELMLLTALPQEMAALLG